MKLLTLFLLSLSSLWAATVTVSFDYNFTGSQICSTTITSNCLEKFETGILVGAVFTKMLDIPLPPNPTGQVTGISGTYVNNFAFGQQILSVQIVGKDSAGNRITSDPTKATVTVVVPPSAPTRVIVVYQ